MRRNDRKVTNILEDKIKGLNCIMSHYTKKDEWEYTEKAVENVAVIRLTVTEWSCKEHNKII